MISTCLPSRRGSRDGGRPPVSYNNLDFFFFKFKVWTHGWMENWILWYIIKKVFRFFELFRARLVYKYAKSANMTPKIFFPIIFNMAVKKCRIWCQFRIHWKVPLSRKFTQRKLEGLEILNTVLKDEKVHNFYTFMLITFLYELFYTFFKACEVSVELCVF